MDKQKLKQLLAAYDIRPTKGKGQNFLMDESVIDVMIGAAQVTPDDAVLEIGPGLGILTSALLRTAKKTVAVELDRQTIPYLQAQFGGTPGFELVEGDILKIKNDELVRHLGSPSYKVVANIPYAITAPLIQKFLTYAPRPTELVLLVQKEVAERIVAKPGELSVLALSVQYAAEADVIMEVPRGKFYPEPNVDSAVLHLKLRSESSRLTPDDEANFFRIVKIGFSAKRKQLHNNLSAGLRLPTDAVKEKLTALGLREDIRAQDVSLGDWKRLSKSLRV